ncbi:DUF3592 domain-containing protein [bacterium]|nr:DUF3592 domain-containing protein [bacterium]
MPPAGDPGDGIGALSATPRPASTDAPGPSPGLAPPGRGGMMERMWGLASMVVGAVLLVLGVVRWRRVQAWLVRAELATAEIVRLESTTPGHELTDQATGRVTAIPVVRFTDQDGEVHEVRSRTGRGLSRLQGRRTIEISYDPLDPTDVRLGRTADRNLAYALGVSGIALILVGFNGLL